MSTESMKPSMPARVEAKELLGRITDADTLTGLLPAAQAVVPGRREPVGQDRESLPARPTNPAPHRDALAPVIVGLTKPLSVADDRVVSAKRTPPRQAIQGNYPGSMSSFVLGSVIKRSTGWHEDSPLTVPVKVSICWRSFTLHVKSVPNEKRISRSAGSPHHCPY